MKDGAREFPTGLLNIAYIQSNNPNMLSIENTIGGITKSRFHFEIGQWYTFTITGSPEGMECKQAYSIEGPGLTVDAGSVYEKTGSWSFSVVNECLILEEDYPLKIFATRDLTWKEGTPMDGVIRNVAFTNTETDATMNTIC